MASFRVQIPDVQDAVQTAIEAALVAAREENADGNQLTCALGFPGPLMGDREIWIDGAFEAELPRYLSGGALRDEAGSVRVKILVTGVVGSMADLRDDALSLAACVEDAIEADPTLGALVDVAKVTKIEGAEGFEGEARHQYGVTVTVGYETAAT